MLPIWLGLDWDEEQTPQSMRADAYHVESAASGLMAGIHTARAYLELPDITFPKETAHGALAHYISNPEIRDFQPMNVNFGLLPSLGKKVRNKKEKNALIAERSLNALQDVLQIIK